MRTADVLARSRFEEWEELEVLMLRTRMNRVEVERLGVLYRRVVSDLATARRDFPSDRVTSYLEGLAARAHPLVFRGRVPVLGDLARLLAIEFPRAVRALRVEVLASLAVFLGGGLVAFALALNAPDMYRSFLPEGLLDRVITVGEEVREKGEGAWAEISGAERPAASWIIATNNIQVTLLAFAGGALLGLLTLHVLASNGILLGLVAACCVHEGAIVPLGVFVSGHGPLELSVVFLAGAAGLSLGRAFLLPGEVPRLQALVTAARRAITVAVGGCVLLVLAGLIEGFLSPSALSPHAKLLTGAVTGAGLWAFLLLSGRGVAGSDGLSGG